MKYLHDLPIEEQFEILSKAQFIALEENDTKEVEKIEKLIQKLIK